MSNMNDIVEKFRYLVEKSKYFTKLKEDEEFLFGELNKLPKDIIKEIQENYKNSDKINKIRYEVANLLLEKKFNKDTFENLKKEINFQNETDILRSWKKNFSILYVFFFYPIKEKVNQYLEDIGNYFLNQLDRKLKLKITDFDGSQNFGDAGCWMALFNPKYEKHTDGIKYFIYFDYEKPVYGTYKYDDLFFNKTRYNQDNITEDTIKVILEDLKENLDFILENSFPINQILYGPPGTGKTYKTIELALKIIGKVDKNNKKNGSIKKNYDKILKFNDKEYRKYIKGIFNYFKKEGQIEFITFHQSYSYEEFVEGIKAKTNDKGIEYYIEDGIFQSFCKKAQEERKNSIEFDQNRNRTIWKVLLGGPGNNKIKSECYRDGYIRFSYEHEYKEDLRKINRNDLNAPLRALRYEMKIGDLVVSSYSNDKIDQIGIIESDYIFLENVKNYRHARKVKWLLPEPKIINFLEINNGNHFSRYSIHKIDPDREKFFKLISDIIGNNKNYVLIIDEINRGNISKIFGELITLIEPSKRLGAEDEIIVKLPYSKEMFGVPKNLYIIGTMNTADRSIALMDTALRRRFEFIEMMPEYDLLKDLKIEGINIKSMLETINKRIEYLYDRDHTIGHAYFLSLKDNPTKEELDTIFRNKIFPLLQEYFYDDWEKIQIVLGDHPEQLKNKDDIKKYQFITSEEVKEEDVIGFLHEDIDGNFIMYEVKKDFELDAYKTIYERPDSSN